ALESYARATGRAALIPDAPRLSELEAKMSASDWNGRGAAFGQLGEPEESYNSYRRALEIEPTAPFGNVNVGISMVRLGRKWEEALPYFEKETQVHPDSALAFDALSRAYLSADRAHDAYAACRTAAELAPDRVEFWRNFAIAAKGTGSQEDYERATATVRKIL